MIPVDSVYVFGNEWLGQDRSAVDLIVELERRGVDCVHVRDPQELVPRLQAGEVVTLLDVALGVDRPVLFDDLKLLEQGRVFSMHDVDLAFLLRLLDAMGVLRPGQVRIVAVPLKGANVEEVLALLGGVL
ncbi:MAG: hypothetical protein HC945_01805 [Nitrosarchaeum sp.]|nr:hypothetical protein [Nitrosarchaeum sp.]